MLSRLLVKIAYALAWRLLPRPAYPAVERGRELRFPRDHGAHADFRAEWWYIAGSIHTPDGRELGLHLTFFRSRELVLLAGGRGRLQPRQMLRGHLAIADPRVGRLIREEVSSSPSLELQSCSEDTTDVAIGGWNLKLQARPQPGRPTHRDRYEARIESGAISLEMEFETQDSPMLQGDGGFSPKGPRPAEASYYYSRPQLTVAGTLDGAHVTGEAWLDHEWSTSYLAPEVSGWDWAGINLSDGGALMLYRLRAKAQGDYYAGGTLLTKDNALLVFGPKEVEFEVVRKWRSPASGAEYPVSLRLRAAAQEWLLEPLMDDQEFDGQATTQTVYWEGAVRALQGGVEVGRGHLELTGYFRPLGF